jgi:hypothetical protein
MLYTKQTSIKATEEEFAAWGRAAEAANMPLRTWIRCILDAGAGEMELFQQLQRAAITAQVEHAAMMRSKRGSQQKDE